MAGATVDVFISYRRSDAAVAARRIRQMLQTYRLPKALRGLGRGRLTVFLDTAYERGAADFYENTIRPALMSARWLLIVATPDAVRRPAGEDWIEREIRDFSSGPNAANIIVVRALGDLMSALPAAIAENHPNMQIIDLRDPGFLGRLSPQRNARLADEKLKLVGPLLGIALEDMPKLRREEERRQVARIGAVAGAASAAVLLAVGLSLFALKSQWDGNQALRESFHATRQSVADLVDQYDDFEALESPARDVVLRDCDLAMRMRQLSGSPEDPDLQLACTIEAQRALALAGRPGEALQAISAALEAEEERAINPGGALTSVVPVVRAGYQTWILLDPAGDATRRFVSFQRKRGEALLANSGPLEDATTASLREAIVAFSDASQFTYELANKAASAGDDIASVQQDYAQAMSDALKASTTLRHVLAVSGDDAGLIAYWTSAADLVQQAAMGEASLLSTTDPPAARAALERALLVFQQPGEVDLISPYRRAGRRAILSAALMVTADTGVQAPLPPPFWDCLSDGRAAASDATAPPDDRDREEGVRALNDCLDQGASLIDSRRAEINRLWRAGNLKLASTLLQQLIAETGRINGFRPSRGPWDDLYRAVAYRDLDIIERAIGREDAARAARRAAMALFEPYLDFDRVDDSAAHVAEAKVAWADVRAAEAAAP